MYVSLLPPTHIRSFERFIVTVILNQNTPSPIERVWKSSMTLNLMNLVNRTINEKLADKAVNEAKGWHNKAKTKLWRHLIIPIRNSFVYKTETNMQQHYDEMVSAFDRYCEAATTDQLKADCDADERETFVKVFGDIQM